MKDFATPVLTSPETRRHLLEEYLQRHARRAAVQQPIPKREPAELAPLSQEQEQVWLHAQMAPDIPLYNEPVTIHYSGTLNVAVLELSFNEILRRHEAWRTSFVEVDGRPMQVVHPVLHVSMPVVDLRNLPAERREPEAMRIATAEARRPIDLTQVPLFRLNLIRLDDNEYRLFLVLSHIIFDGVALYRVLLPELSALYDAFAAGQPSAFQDLPIQYPDYACWQRGETGGTTVSQHLAYWRRQLTGNLPALYLPIDRPHSPVQTFRGSMYPFSLGKHLSTALKEFGKREAVSLFQILFAGFAALLYRYSSEELIPIGSVTAGRNRPELAGQLGYFLNTVVLRADLSGNPTFGELVRRVRNVTIEALEHDCVPFRRIVEEMGARRDASHNPFFQALFSLEPPLPQLGPAWRLTQMDVDTGVTKYDLYLETDERSDGVLARFHYSTDLFDSETIARMAAHWRTLLEAAVNDPACRLSALSILPDPEQRQILLEWNETRRTNPSACIHRLVEAQVEQSPNAVAVVMEGRRLTFRELNQSANQLARYLRKRGVGPDVLVGLCVERSPEMVIALLGILKAGGAYIPLDPALPDERLKIMLSDANPAILVTQRLHRHRFQHPEIFLLDEANATETENTENLNDGAKPNNLACVIYTSGSTGEPKGVQVEHHSIVNILCSIQAEPGIGPEDVLVAVTTLSFDISGLEIYLPLIAGSRLVLASMEAARDPALLSALLSQSAATIMQATPATWTLLIESGWQGLPHLKVLCGGEALVWELAHQLTQRARWVWNLYGPTETTIWSTKHLVNTSVPQPISIGRPIANTRIYILDGNGNPVPIGIPGEIHIGGEGVARGYLNRPELTAQKFIDDPFVTEPGSRLYRTGDAARYLRDGTIEYLGRLDGQVKFHGFRIELGEIEAALTQHPAVTAAVAVVRETGTGAADLVGYVICRNERAASVQELRSFLRQKLPAYMTPTRFVLMDSFPLKLNGKVDRRALPAPGQRDENVDGVLAAPENEIEIQLKEIWERVLDIRPIGVQDDFFAIGGHSLAAVRVFASIEASFGKRIPLAVLLRAPTIRQLAVILKEESPSQNWPSLVPIQTNGSRPPLFCVHGHSGEILFYRPLARQLGHNQPFYGLQARRRRDMSSANTIESIAKDYVSEIRRKQAHGPYFIAGYCFGAIVAFEMAHQLVRDGERVAFLGLFLDHTPKLGFFVSLRNRFLLHLDQLRRTGTRAKMQDLTANLAAKIRNRIWHLAYPFFGRGVLSSIPLFENLPEMNVAAARRYTPKVYPGRMTVFLSGPVPPGFSPNSTSELYGLRASGMDLRVVPGDRTTMLQEPFVGVLATELRSCIDRAELS